MIWQMVKYECLRFGIHVDIQVSYKILWLEIPKVVLILHQPYGFKRGCFEAILIKSTLCLLGVNTTMMLLKHSFEVVMREIFK
jgi:hypothetical protein